MLKISVVCTLYRSSIYIEEFYQRVKKTAEMITENFEVIFVNDGSPDNSLDVALSLREKDHRVKVIDLSRNFGHHKAIMTGLSYANGDYVFLIDVDLEEPPELLYDFWMEMEKHDNIDVIYGVQEKRRGNLKERITGGLFYKIYNYLSNDKIVNNSAMCRLMNSNYVSALVSHHEREIFLAGLWAITGYNQQAISVKKYSSSPTTYSFQKKLALMVNAITAFSNRPLEFIFSFGSIISLVAFAFVIFLVLRQLIFGISMQGWTSIVVSIWLMGGMIIFCLGIVGIYISKIFTEVKQRPYTIIKKIYE
ncbi:glycosyltransferase family 2 protein [Paenibacillus eucommiae]|uniref:Glycosyltransferase n=1 Tax=Paenibacillus eucommiae TaxID=1355755 RepID=A0ABS4IU93_9BACL|nr:glycosyltransferase family 2 protein [Paenibacillus eucommiae]MBP1991142.1 putative glycosyltransferase [Paenibacillus eucommiae]